jgi:cytochrome c biogenesis protein
MPKAKNTVWRFFASVKLALITLILLAAISIIGTLIQQGQEFSYYVQEYGPNLARFFEVLDIPNMYSSWWFLSLLGLFAINLVVCSFERLPDAWRLVVLDNLSVDSQQLGKMRFTHRMATSLPAPAAAEQMHRTMIDAGWRNPQRQERQESILFFTQKGAWTRLGVYVVHLSILIIMIGAVTGTFFGYRAYVFLPEGRSSSDIFLQETREPVPLGFELQCDRFNETFYPNGMVKESRADLTIFDPDRPTPYQKSIIVNDPLSYRGLTFYLADTFPLDEFYVVLANRTTGMEQAFLVPPERDVDWPETNASFRIQELKKQEDGVVQQAKILFTADSTAEPSAVWIRNKETVTIRQSGQEITLSCRQLYNTLLLVTKDPGVWIVYFGCILMIIGLAIIFFLSHRRIWVQITTDATLGSLILVSGACNKNQPAFERQFQQLIDRYKTLLTKKTTTA